MKLIIENFRKFIIESSNAAEKRNTSAEKYGEWWLDPNFNFALDADLQDSEFNKYVKKLSDEEYAELRSRFEYNKTRSKARAREDNLKDLETDPEFQKAKQMQKAALEKVKQYKQQLKINSQNFDKEMDGKLKRNGRTYSLYAKIFGAIIDKQIQATLNKDAKALEQLKGYSKRTGEALKTQNNEELQKIADELSPKT